MIRRGPWGHERVDPRKQLLSCTCPLSAVNCQLSAVNCQSVGQTQRKSIKKGKGSPSGSCSRVVAKKLSKIVRNYRQTAFPPPQNTLYRRSAEMRCAQDSRTTHICNPRIDRIRGFRNAICVKPTKYAHCILRPPTKPTKYARRLPIITYIVDPPKCDVLRTRELRTFEIRGSTE